MKHGVQLIAEERKRQIEVEGWTPDHDGQHTEAELAFAAVCYAHHAAVSAKYPYAECLDFVIPQHWPWGSSWWKPAAHPIRNLEKAGALIAAEIDRLQGAVGEADADKPSAKSPPDWFGPALFSARFQDAFAAFAQMTFEVHQAKGFAVDEQTAQDPVWQGNQIALMHSELSEAHEGIRKGLMDDKLPHRQMLEVELADVMIRVMNFASQCGLDVAGAMVEKNAFNATREHMHGGKKF